MYHFIPYFLTKGKNEMANSILITGGAASGKSRFAITHYHSCDYVLYLKAGSELDADIKQRINFENEKQGIQWDIVRFDTPNPAELVGDHKFVIFDSLSSFTAIIINELCGADEITDAMKKSIEKTVIERIQQLREKVAENFGSIIIITLETGFSVAPVDKHLATFREILGHVNQRIANTSDDVYFSASGIQFKIK